MAKLALALRFGYSDGTSILVVGQSKVVDDIVITVAGVGKTTLGLLAPLGTDSASTANTEAMFYKAGVITGLSAFNEYEYSAIQAGETITGKFPTTPTENDDYSFFAGTCDNISSLGGVAAGMYTHIKDYMINGPLRTIGLLHHDDHYGYMDFNSADDGVDSVAGAFAYESGEVYEYALGAAGALGLLGEGGNEYCTYGHNLDRQYVYGNLPVWPQKGDHDSGADNMGWSLDPSISTQYTNAMVVWDALLSPLQPPNIDGVNSNAWGAQIGSVYVASMDGISNATGDGDADNAPTVLFGNTQIDSVLSALDNSSPFKILSLANGIRYLNNDSPRSINSDGAQLPIALHATEFPRLVTDTGNAEQSIMENNNTNGKFGTLLATLGDYHGLKFQKNENTAGTLDEWFYSINVGTLTGSVNFEEIPAGTVYDGTTVEYADGNVSGVGGNDYWAVRFDVYGSRYPKEIHATAIDKNGDEVFARKFVHQMTVNDAVAVDAEIFDKKTMFIDD